MVTGGGVVVCVGVGLGGGRWCGGGGGGEGGEGGVWGRFGGGGVVVDPPPPLRTRHHTKIELSLKPQQPPVSCLAICLNPKP